MKRVVTLALLITLTACGGGGGSGPSPTPPSTGGNTGNTGGDGSSGGSSGGGTTNPDDTGSMAPDYTGVGFSLPDRSDENIDRTTVVPEGIVDDSEESYLNFESGPVRPLALSPDKSQLFVTNIPNGTLDIFDVLPNALTLRHSIPVGIDPVAVAAPTSDEVWVVNHLSDSVSIIDLSQEPPFVRQTLLVGDEPRDIVFGGPDNRWAFITTARRGQNSPVDPALTTEGLGRANVWVFERNQQSSHTGGAPAEILTLFGDKPRALAVSPDGDKVYASIFHSGNQTISLSDLLTKPVEDYLIENYLYDIRLRPLANIEGIEAPSIGRIIKMNPESGKFEDVNGVDVWDGYVPFSLPDLDVFEIDASGDLPVVAQEFPHVGTILFNLAVNPATGVVYAANSDANNLTRFEGAGTLSGSTVKGNLHQYRIASINPVTGAVANTPLNNHINYAAPNDPVPANVKARSLATPMELVPSEDGEKLYVTAMGSNKVAVIDTASLEDSSYTASSDDHIEISGGGPAGLVLDEQNARAYVYSRFANSVSILSVNSHPGAEIATAALSTNPEPQPVRDGRRFMYDARLTSQNGEASCSSCHVFGKTDSLAWDLSDPDLPVLQNFNEQGSIAIDLIEPILGIPEGHFIEHHPIKGPMLTQSLIGIDGHGPMHWRGDRSAGQVRDDPRSTTDEITAFKTFNANFTSLLGRERDLSPPELDVFTAFSLDMYYPPNPIRQLDNSLTVSEELGRKHFEDIRTSSSDENGVPQKTCNDCHRLDPDAGLFGSNGKGEFDALAQLFKVPHLRNLYDRVGMFGAFNSPGFVDHLGPQIRGYGYSHEGFTSGLARFVGLEDPIDSPRETFKIEGTPEEERAARRGLVDFMHAFDSGLAPIVGQQLTTNGNQGENSLLTHTSETTSERLTLLRQRALVEGRRECDLVSSFVLEGETRSSLLTLTGDMLTDWGAVISASEFDAYVQEQNLPVTHTCWYPGAGKRVALDRDEDGVFNYFEAD